MFIHGVGSNKRNVETTQLDFFKDKNILTYDLIGHGKTPLKKIQLNFEDFTKTIN